MSAAQAHALMLANDKGQTAPTTHVATSVQYGEYSISGLNPGAYEVFVNMGGFGTGQANDVGVGDLSTTAGVTLTMGAAATVQGQVTDLATGLPVTGALVGTTAVISNPSVAVNANGQYLLSLLPAGQAQVIASAPDYLPWAMTLTLAAGQTQTYNVALRHAGSIGGRVLRTTGGTPVAGLPILVTSPMGLPLTVTTGLDGSFDMTGLPDGEYLLAAGGGPAFGAAQQTYRLSAAQNVYTGTIPLDETEVTGTVYAAGHVPDGPGTAVALLSGNEILDTAPTDSAGRYRFLVFQPGLYAVAAVSQTLGIQVSSPFNVALAATVPPHNLSAGSGSLTVHVHSAAAGDPPVAGAVVLLWRTDGGLSDGLYLGTTSDANGQAIVSDLAAGSYQVQVMAHGYARSLQPAVLGASPQALSFLLQPGYVVQGTVSDSGGNPVAGAMLEMADPSSGATYLAATDANGNYSFDTLPAGVFDLWATGEGYVPAFVPGINSAAGGSQTFNVTLGDGGTTLTGQVLDTAGQPVVGAAVALLNSAGGIVLATPSGITGTYSMPFLPSGTFTVGVSAAGMGTSDLAVSLSGTGQATQNLTLPNVTAIGLALASAPHAAGSIARPQDFNPYPGVESVIDYGNRLNNTWFNNNLPVPSNAELDNYLNELAEIQKDPLFAKCPGAILGHSQAYNAIDPAIQAFNNWDNAYRTFMQLHHADVVNATIGYGKAGFDFLTAGSAAEAESGFVFVEGAAEHVQQQALLLGVNVGFDAYQQAGDGDWDTADVTLHGAAIPVQSAYAKNLAATLPGPHSGIQGPVVPEGQAGSPVIQEAESFALAANVLTLGYNVFQGMPQEMEDALTSYNLAEARYHQLLPGVEPWLAYLRALLAKCRYNPNGDPPTPPDPQPWHPDPDPYAVASGDPNAKTTVGYGPLGFIGPNGSMLYTIDFTNEASASAPAEQVVITDPLSSNIDWSSVQLQEIGFNNVTITVTPARQQYDGMAQVATDPNPVHVQASLNPATGLLVWRISSVDQVTGGLPADPLAGFLPPDKVDREGEGFVTFSARPAALPSGTTIINRATIVFDANAPIPTRPVTNTLDTLPPTGSVTPLPGASPPVFTVRWSGSDGSGSGVAAYDIYVSTDSGPFIQWLAGTTATSAVFTGVVGHHYGFYSVAEDNVGNRQSVPTAAQATTLVVNLREGVYLPLVRR